ncbi:MAG: 1-acyl-sn-glycerol-3-phosphate acyltransferase [Gammaproteobacteria bacterium]|nr:1-acyl-sn-glycerol-3-phosphate acyltransferase [Gammaproteobacteria bacterium]
MRPTAIAGTAARVLYGCYAWTALLSVVLPLAAVLGLTPGLARRRRAAKAAARLFFRLIGSPVRVEGQMPADGACVVVANHSSYLDGLILTAALPPTFTFLIKHEMSFMPLAGFILKRLGSRFVDRADARHRHQTVRRLVSSALNGDALALFPEGTFDAAEGLKPFQPGAFGAAWRARVPIVPAVVTGARRKLPSGAALPAPGPLSVRICPPLAAEAYDTARDLLLATRAVMLEHMAEPDLGAASRRADAVPAGDIVA